MRTFLIVTALIVLGAIFLFARINPTFHISDAISFFDQNEAKAISEDDFVVVKDGHLSVNGQRKRYWAAVGKVYANARVRPEDNPQQIREKVALSRKSTQLILDRLEVMGFNAVRLWDGFMDVDYEKGDGSTADCADFFIAEAKERGFKIWCAGMNRNGAAKPEDVSIIDEPETAEAWKEAIAEKLKEDRGEEHGWELRNNPAVFWDKRLEALTTRNKQKVATHFNHHSGLRWCDDPVFAIWELSNEEWWIRRMLGGSWQKLPDFFRQTLLEKWYKFLVKKYQTTDGLQKAWGDLLPGEDLEKRTILFAPMANATKTGIALNDANPEALAAVQAMKQEYNQEDFPNARGSDVLEFLVDMHLNYKKRQAETIKKLGQSTSLSPMVFDTGIGYEIQSQYLHQNADAVAHDAYVNGYGPSLDEKMKLADGAFNELEKNRLILEAERVASNEGHWVNWLLKPPGISQGVPWLEHNKIEGKPYLVYETQIQQPAKYRADFPLRLAALASIQDWDWVTWHYFGDGSLDSAASTTNPFHKKVDVTTGSHPQGYHFTYDEVQTALMRAAGFIFIQNVWEQAPNPTTFIYGKKSLYDPQSMNYGHSYGLMGMNMLQTVYEHGVRIRIDTSRQDDEVLGPMVLFEDRNKHNPYRPTDQITFDWKAGFIKVIAPKAVTFAGYLPNDSDLKWGDISMSGINVHNPEGIYDPIDPEKPYFAVSIYTMDGQPLESSDVAGISLASTSFNTGYQMGNVKNNAQKPIEGTLPVLVARIGATFHIPEFANGHYTMYDFNNKIIEEGALSVDGKLTIESNKPVYYIVLNRS